MTDVRLPGQPGLSQSYLGLVRTRRPGRYPRMPDQRWVLGPWTPPAAQLQAYTQCLNLGGEGVPLCFPHALAGQLHMRMFANPDFPFSMAGAVHTHTRIERVAPIDLSAPLVLGAWFTDLGGVNKAAEFEVATELWSGGQSLWRSHNRFRVRGRFSLPAPTATEPLETPVDPQHEATWPLPYNLGRRYAAVCGDWNPIHISSASARMFGMKSSIVHGYANLAMALDRLFDESGLRSVEAAFKGPAFLGSDVVAKADETGRFALWTPADERPSVVGRAV